MCSEGLHAPPGLVGGALTLSEMTPILMLAPLMPVDAWRGGERGSGGPLQSLGRHLHIRFEEHIAYHELVQASAEVALPAGGG